MLSCRRNRHVIKTYTMWAPSPSQESGWAPWVEIYDRRCILHPGIVNHIRIILGLARYASLLAALRMHLKLCVSSEKRSHFEALIWTLKECYESSGTLHPMLLGNYRRQGRAPCLGLKIPPSSYCTHLRERGDIFWGIPRLTTPNSRGRISISRFPFYFL